LFPGMLLSVQKVEGGCTLTFLIHFRKLSEGILIPKFLGKTFILSPSSDTNLGKLSPPLCSKQALYKSF
jgi:hypothetical protein